MSGTSFERAIEIVKSLSHANLKRLREVIDVLLSGGSIDTDRGYIEYKYISRGGRRYGPYKYRRRMVNGKLTSVYEGKASAEEKAQYEQKFTE